MTALAARHQQRSPRRPRGAAAWVRLLLNWLLLAVLALDLAGSPLHAHRHDGGFSLAGAAWAAADPHDDVARAHAEHDGAAEAHADHDDGAELSHSTVALRGQVLDLPDAPVVATLCSTTPWPTFAATASTAAVRLPWPPDRHRAGASAFRSLPPDGRAPPLHA